MTSPSPVTAMPTARTAGRPFDPPGELTRLREQSPLRRMTYPDGHCGWVATSHAVVREILADPRFSIRSELRHMPIPGVPGAADPQPAQPGFFGAMDPPDHTRYRRLLTGQFTVRRMRTLTEHVREVTAEHLNAMEWQGPSADLVTALAQPLPAQVMCELLGIPYAEREHFQQQALSLFRLDAAPEQIAATYAQVHGFIGELVRAKRAAPTDDMLSGLAESDLTDDEIVNIGFTLLGAGLDTTANMLGLGTFALLSHPEQLAALRADPDIAGTAVEELIRYLSIIPFTVRTALEDAEVDGQLIGRGETVTVSIPTANRDPEQFADPDTLDLLRPTGGHVGFGHGIHQCLGQQLARVEMEVVLPALVTRFPTLRLAVEPEGVALRTDMLIYGVHGLPVTWEV